jgi:4-amino-4-deoxy-L-arabinose transferase-like glycosyltransferase
MRQRVVWLLLFIIVLLAAFVRFHNLSSVPPSPYLDEVSNGYNSYSLLKTGNDEYGRHLPILMQAYNDFRPTLFVYFMMPFIATLGLNVFAIRLPAVVLSVLTTISMYFLTKYLFSNLYVTLNNSEGSKKLDSSTSSQNDEKLKIRSDLLGLAAAFLFAISPWSIYSSHISDEINMSLSFFVFGLTFSMYSMQVRAKRLLSRPSDSAWRDLSHKSSSLVRDSSTSLGMTKLRIFTFCVSIIFFVLAFYAYHGIKLFLPFFAAGVAILFFKEFLARKKLAILGMVLGVLLLIPLALAFRAPGTVDRLGGVSNQHPELTALSSNRILYDITQKNKLGEIFDNRRLLLLLEFTNDYLRNFDPTWLFLPQNNKTYLVPNVGPMYLFELPLLLFGIFYLVKEKTISGKSKIVLLLWIVFSQIPAAISSESPHLNRGNTLLPAFTIIEAAGLVFLCSLFLKMKWHVVRVGSLVLVGAVTLFSFLWFWQSYFVEFPREQSKVYQYGAVQAFTYAQEHEQQYAKIIVSNSDTLLDSYMYYLFTTKYDPATYQKNGGTHSAFFTDTHVIGKYDFRNPNLYEPKPENGKTKILYIVNPGEVSLTIQQHEQLHVIQKYHFLDGKESIVLLEGTV